MRLDLIFYIDSVITAVGSADKVKGMHAASSLTVFVASHPSTKMLALAFLVMVGMALRADGFPFHIKRGFISAPTVFDGADKARNTTRQKREHA